MKDFGYKTNNPVSRTQLGSYMTDYTRSINARHGFPRQAPARLAPTPMQSYALTSRYTRSTGVRGLAAGNWNGKRAQIYQLVARVKRAKPPAQMSGLGAIDLSAVHAVSNNNALTADDVRWALRTDLEGLSALGRALASLNSAEVAQAGNEGRTLLLSIGEGIADPWMSGLAGGQNLGVQYARGLGSWFSSLVKNVGQVVGTVAPIAAPILAATGVGIPIAAAVAAGGAVASKLTAPKPQGFVADPGGDGMPGSVENSDGTYTILPVDTSESAPWWSGLLDVAKAAGQAFSATKTALTPAQQRAATGAPGAAIAPPAPPSTQSPSTSSTPPWLLPAAAAVALWAFAK